MVILCKALQGGAAAGWGYTMLLMAMAHTAANKVHLQQGNKQSPS